ncbi:Asx homology domain-containing protein [Sordaria brevicollis]|uniref:Asx homology domain-containing protein n=1 Tax=Sordaria brevicollis TaxID=83679 RepID=A0AAE0PN03_SORBR|nr:Asx homology domain-containing protein [Sordaria brevicollis]
MAEDGSSSPLSSALSSPPASPPRSENGENGDSNSIHVQETDKAAQVVLEAPAAEEPAAEEQAVQELETKKPASKKSAAKKPAVGKSTTKRPAARKPSTRKAAAVKPEVEEPAVNEPAADEPAVEKPGAKKAAAKKPAAKKSKVEEPLGEETAVQDAIIEEPVAEKPVVEEPAVHEPVVEQLAAPKGAVKKSTAKRPAAKKTAVRKAAAKKSAVEQTVDETADDEASFQEPVVEEQAIEEPAAEESADEELVVATPLAKKKKAVKRSAATDPAVQEPAPKRPKARKAAVNKSAVERPVVKEEPVEEPEIGGHGELEEERTTPLAVPGPASTNKLAVLPSDQLDAPEPEVKRSSTWTAINRPPRSPPSVRLPDIAAREEETNAPSGAPSVAPEVVARQEEAATSSKAPPAIPEVTKRRGKPAATPSRAPPATKEVPTPKEDVPAPEDVPSATSKIPRREEQTDAPADAPSATPSSVPKKRKPLPGAANHIREVPDVLEVRTTGKPKLTRGKCTPCHENKLKCLKEKPICSRCAESGTHCVYAFEQPRKYGSASARPVLSEAEAVPRVRSEATAPVQNSEVEKEVDSSKIAATVAVGPSINGHGTKNDPQDSRGTRSESRNSQPDTESRKRKASEEDKSSSAKKPRHATAPKKTTLDKKWEAPFVYTDEKSPLTNADLRAILLLPQAWDVLTSEERKEILAKFPDDSHILDAGTEKARPDLVALRNNDHFRYDCARYLENIERGRHDEQWLQEAWVAHEKHKRGDYDDFLRKEFENDWATKIPKELLQRIGRESEMAAQDGVVATSQDTSTANGQHKALPGRAKGASAVQKVPSVSPASVGATKTNGTVAKNPSNGREVSNINASQYTQLRFEIPPEA